jgi:hypothetical protein
MMGVPIWGPSLIYGDNMYVIHNTSWPESTLKNKSNSIAYHAVRDLAAMGESLSGHVGTNSNVADLATKVLVGKKRQSMVNRLLYNIYNNNKWMINAIFPNATGKAWGDCFDGQDARNC